MNGVAGGGDRAATTTLNPEMALVGMGFSADGARAYVEMAEAFNDGVINGIETRSTENSTPTSRQDFAKVFAAAYNAG